jgi:hypothetical protein
MSDHMELQQLKVVDPDAWKCISELTADQGLHFEEHTVVTQDGYYLSVYHIWKT